MNIEDFYHAVDSMNIISAQDQRDKITASIFDKLDDKTRDSIYKSLEKQSNFFAKDNEEKKLSNKELFDTLLAR